MNKDEKDAFLNVMSLVSDYPKYIMLEKFLEGQSLTVKTFTESDLRLPCRAVYQNLRGWRADGLLSLDPDTRKIYLYKLNVDNLIEKLS